VIRCQKRDIYRQWFRITSWKDCKTDRELVVIMLDLQTKGLKKCSSIEEAK